MDPDSKASAWIRACPWLLGGLIVVSAAVLVGLGKMDGKDFINALGTAGIIVGVGRQMTLPSATTTTKQTDPSSGVVTETKTLQSLGMPPAPAPIIPTATTPIDPTKGATP